MSSGEPNWIKLAEMGKLPHNQRGKVPFLAQSDASEKELERIKEGVCDDCREKLFKNEDKRVGTVELKCEVDGCDYIAKGRSEAIVKSNLRLHGRKHEVKK